MSDPQSKQPKNQPAYLTTKQAADYLGLSTQFLEIARCNGDGPVYVKLRKAVRYRPSDLDQWMTKHLTDGQTSSTTVGADV